MMEDGTCYSFTSSPLPLLALATLYRTLNLANTTRGRFPSQRLTRTQALRALTIDAAYASFSEQLLGSLEPGKKADFVVLGVDVMKVEDEKLREAVLRGGSGEGEGIVKATVLDGGLVFGDLGEDC